MGRGVGDERFAPGVETAATVTRVTARVAGTAGATHTVGGPIANAAGSARRTGTVATVRWAGRAITSALPTASRPAIDPDATMIESRLIRSRITLRLRGRGACANAVAPRPAPH